MEKPHCDCCDKVLKENEFSISVDNHYGEQAFDLCLDCGRAVLPPRWLGYRLHKSTGSGVSEWQEYYDVKDAIYKKKGLSK